jgi:Tfp pilus assembly protein PilN
MRAVNLLVVEQTDRRTPHKAVLAGAASSTAVLMLLGAMYVNAHATVRDREASLKQLKAELAALPPQKTTVEPNGNAALAADKAGRLAVLSSALNQRVRWDRILRELALVLPDDVWLESLDASSPVSPATAAPAPGTTPTPGSVAGPASGTTFGIIGSTYNNEGVARLLIHLQLIPDLENVQLESAANSGKTDADVPPRPKSTLPVQFTISASVKAPGVSR